MDNLYINRFDLFRIGGVLCIYHGSVWQRKRERADTSNIQNRLDIELKCAKLLQRRSIEIEHTHTHRER